MAHSLDRSEGEQAESGGVSRLSDYAEDATGFGALEFRTARDLVIRPQTVLLAYLRDGSTGGGLYARPMRFYIALSGVLMFYLFLIGGTQDLLMQFPAEVLDRLIARSGKSREAFMNDADGWLSLAAVPVLAVFYALGVAPLIRWWMRSTWRIAFRATFALLCAWTVPVLPLGPLPWMENYRVPGSILVWAMLAVAFVRMGRGLWWTGGWEAAGKSAMLFATIMIAVQIGMLPVFGVGVLGGLYGS